jgi:hypothetical protein
LAPFAAAGPLFVTTMKYVCGSPGSAVARPSVFVIAKSALGKPPAGVSDTLML